ncbi:GATS protein-like 3 [Mortierella sp. GBA43]|nr:GATS protein-like 3 [Mortierella sp. GBA43]
MSTYQTDLLFVQEDRLPIVFTTLSTHGLPIVGDDNLGCTPPDTPILDQRRPWEMNMENALEVKHMSELSLATPPGSRDSNSDYGDDDRDSATEVSEEGEGEESGVTGNKPLLPLDIISAHQRGIRGGDDGDDGGGDGGGGDGGGAHGAGSNGYYDDSQLAKASPTTTTAIEIRQQAVRMLPQNCLRCVGLNTDLESGHQAWILKIIKILFYHDKVKEEANRAGNGPSYDAPRFFSFTTTSECVSMIADTYILKEFEEHELFMDMETPSLRLIQLDLHCFGLDKFGIIHSVARPLTEAGIDLLYLSTFSTANILVVEHRLADAERILSGGGGVVGGMMLLKGARD